MSSAVDYKGLQLVTSDALATARSVLNPDLMELADRAGPVHLADADPTPANDCQDTAGLGKPFYTFSKWLNTVTGELFFCTDQTAAAAVWRSIGEKLDWQAAVIDQIGGPPGSPSDGDRYLVIAAEGDWAEHDNQIAQYADVGGWHFTLPGEGMAVCNATTQRMLVYNGTAWVLLGSVVDHGALAGLTGDDHPQYVLADGTRGFTGPVTVSGAHDADRGLVYVDGADHGYLVLNAPSTGQAGQRWESGGVAAKTLYRPAGSRDLRIADNATAGAPDMMSFWTGGNVGIGLPTDPGYGRLVVQGGDIKAVYDPQSHVGNAGEHCIAIGVSDASYTDCIMEIDVVAQAATLRTSNVPIDLAPGGLNAMRIFPGGNVGIGTSTDNSSGRLQVNGDVNLPAGCHYRIDGTPLEGGMTLRAETTLGTTDPAPLYLEGTSLSPMVPTDAVWNFEILLAGATAGCGDVYSFVLRGTAVNAGGTLTIGLAPLTTLQAAKSTILPDVAADGTNLVLSVSDSAAGGDTICWVAILRTAEVSFPAP